MLEADDTLDDAVFLSKRVITLSGAGKFVRAWSTAVRVHADVLHRRFVARGLAVALLALLLNRAN